jgi:orotate phosphoribosyltransferase
MNNEMLKAVWDFISSSQAILAVLAIAGVVQILDTSGFLPEFLAKWIARNRYESTLKALKQIGVRVDWDGERGAKLSTIIKNALSLKEPAYIVELRCLLEEDTHHTPVTVGDTTIFHSDCFIDAMGASTSPGRANRFAMILKTHHAQKGLPDFDLVATPKTGSPLIGYEFARLTGKSLVLGATQKGSSNVMGNHLCLDYPNNMTLKGKRILLVDDSTTGGGKMIKLIEDLRKDQAVIENALVLFEPQGKGAKEKLAKINVVLHSVIDGPTGRV